MCGELLAADPGTGWTTTGAYAYRRSDGIAVIPAALLGP